MSSPVSVPGSVPGSARALSPPRLRHGAFAAALLVVAGLRLTEGDVLWAVLLAAAGLVEIGLVVATRRDGTPEPPSGNADRRLPRRTVVEQSLLGHRRAHRLWLVCLTGCMVTAAATLAGAPTIAAVLAVVALVSLQRVRRERRSIATLQRLPARTAS